MHMRSYLTGLHLASVVGLFMMYACLSAFAAERSLAQGQFTLTGGNQTATITTGTAAGQPTAVINTAASISFKRQSVISKITVQTSCPSQAFTLTVEAISSTGGTAAASVNLIDGMLATDFVTGIPPKPPGTTHTATLRYTASSTFAQGNSAEFGNDVHTVTFTLLAQ